MDTSTMNYELMADIKAGVRTDFYQDARGEWRWRRVADNNRIIACSGEGYINRADCEAGFAAALVMGCDGCDCPPAFPETGPQPGAVVGMLAAGIAGLATGVVIGYVLGGLL